MSETALVRPRRSYMTKSAGSVPKPTSAIVSRQMRSNKRSGTQPELVMARVLRRKLIRSSLPGSPDFVYPRAKLAVFLHGDFWHLCPLCKISMPKTHASYWKKKLERNVERDRLNKEELESMGWNVLEVWEHEVKADPKAVATRIRELSARSNCAVSS